MRRCAALLAAALLAAAPSAPRAGPAEDYAAALRAAVVPPSSNPRIPAQLEQALLRAADAGHAEAQLLYGLLLANLRRLASREVPVAAWLNRADPVRYPLPGPDIAEARRRLEALRDHPGLGARAREGLAYLAAGLEPSDLAAGESVDALLGDAAEARLAAAILLEMAGRCPVALSRYRALHTEAPDPVLAARIAACEAGWERLPPRGPLEAAADAAAGAAAAAAGRSRPAPPPALPPPAEEARRCAIRFGSQPGPAPWRFDLATRDGNRQAQAALFRLADGVACLWEKVALASDAAGLDPALRIARHRRALDAMGQPFASEAQPTAMALAALLLESGAPVGEALAVLPRAGLPGRWRAATLLREGRLLPPDPAAERALLEAGGGGADAETARRARFRLAVMLRDGLGGPADPYAAMRIFEELGDPPSRAAIADFLAAAPWRLTEETEPPPAAPSSARRAPAVPGWLDPLLLQAQLHGFASDPRAARPMVLPVASWPAPGMVLFVAQPGLDRAMDLLRLVDAPAGGRPEVRRVASVGTEAMAAALAACAPPREGRTSRAAELAFDPVPPVAVALGPGAPALRFAVSAMEGYAGGGGSFRGVLFARLNEGALQPLLCVETEGSQNLAGSWLPDGRRERVELEDHWTLRIGPPRASGWRDIVARQRGRRSVTYRWTGQGYAALR